MSATPPSTATRTFVLGMMHLDGRLVAEELYDVGAAGGFTVHQIRLCLGRLVTEGLFTQTGRGRRAVLHPTSAGARLLDPEPGFLRLAFAQDAGHAPWDGRWHLVTFNIGESRRHARNTMREQLTRMGAAVTSGVYVCANDWTELVVSLAQELGVTDDVSLAASDRFRLGADTDPVRIARRLWPLAEIADRWQRFTVEHRPTVARLSRATDRPPADVHRSFADTIELVAAFDRCMQNDPLLPPELLPTRWPGAAGRQLLLRSARAAQALTRAVGTATLFSRFDDVIDAAENTHAAAPVATGK